MITGINIIISINIFLLGVHIMFTFIIMIIIHYNQYLFYH